MGLRSLVPRSIRNRIRRARSLAHAVRVGLRRPARAPFERFETASPEPAPPAEPIAARASRTQQQRTDERLDLSVQYGERAAVIVPEGVTVLEAALDAGLDVPFSCQMGGCGACACTLVSGEVDMEEPHCLSDDELAAGIILPCVSHPLSPVVVVPVDDEIQSPTLECS